MIHLKIKHVYRYITLITLFLIFGCSLNNELFNVKNPKKNIRLEKLNETVSNFKKESCSCNIYYDSTIRISKKIDENSFLVRDYHSQDFYTIGKLKNNKKIDLWNTYCLNIKVLEEFWSDGNLVWIKKIDSSGKIIETIHIGHETENF
jgi:hypothetical protein